jgi:homoserine/homoserine lactone efflux protein
MVKAWIMSLDAWLTFVVIWTLAGLPLGPNAVHTINVTVRYGYPKCLAAPIGMALACIIHATAGALGIGALLLVFPEVLLLLKLSGAAYLAWLGMQLWRRRTGPVTSSELPDERWPRLVISACGVSLVNPRAILSYVAIFSPFIVADMALIPQLVILIPTATALVFLNYVGYSMLAWPIRNWVNSDCKRHLLDRIAGSMFIGFASMLLYSAVRSSR